MAESIASVHLWLFLDHHILVQYVVLALLTGLLVQYLVSLRRKYVAIVDFSHEYFAEAALGELVKIDVIDIVDVYVVEHQVVFAGVSVTRLDGHGDHGADELQFLVCQLEAVIDHRQTIVKEHALLEEKAVSADPSGQWVPVFYCALDVHCFGLVLE